jgi:hypothetical protein
MLYHGYPHLKLIYAFLLILVKIKYFFSRLEGVYNIKSIQIIALNVIETLNSFYKEWLNGQISISFTYNWRY